MWTGKIQCAIESDELLSSEPGKYTTLFLLRLLLVVLPCHVVLHLLFMRVELGGVLVHDLLGKRDSACSSLSVVFFPTSSRLGKEICNLSRPYKCVVHNQSSREALVPVAVRLDGVE